MVTGVQNCGSSMVIEYQADQVQGDEDEGVSLGIPACEMLDLTAITETTNRSSTPRTFSREPSTESMAVTNLSVTADIHNHVVNSPDTALPDLLPRPEPARSRDLSGDENSNKEKSSSPALVRSE